MKRDKEISDEELAVVLEAVGKSKEPEPKKLTRAEVDLDLRLPFVRPCFSTAWSTVNSFRRVLSPCFSVFVCASSFCPGQVIEMVSALLEEERKEHQRALDAVAAQKRAAVAEQRRRRGKPKPPKFTGVAIAPVVSLNGEVSHNRVQRTGIVKSMSTLVCGLLFLQTSTVSELLCQVVAVCQLRDADRWKGYV